MTATEEKKVARSVAAEVIASLRAEGVISEPKDERPCLSDRDVARRLGISQRSAREMFLAGVIPSFKVGPKDGSRVCLPADLDEYMRQQQRAAKKGE